jgi:hypothetical protein
MEMQEAELNDNVPEIANLILRVLEKVKDLYQVLPAVNLITEFLTWAPSKVPKLFLQRSDVPKQILKLCSTPALHVPAYNFGTRNAIFQIYQAFLLNKDLLLS